MEARWGLGGRGETVRAKIIQLHLADGAPRADKDGKAGTATGVARIHRGHPEDIVHKYMERGVRWEMRGGLPVWHHGRRGINGRGNPCEGPIFPVRRVGVSTPMASWATVHLTISQSRIVVQV